MLTGYLFDYGTSVDVLCLPCLVFGVCRESFKPENNERAYAELYANDTKTPIYSTDTDNDTSCHICGKPITDATRRSLQS